MRPALPYLAAVLAAVIVATWPLVPSLAGAAIGHPYGDLVDHYWGTWWFGGELLQGRLPLTTTLTHFPTPQPLWHVDPVGALLALPLRPLGLTPAWNLLVLLQVALGAVAAWWVGTDATGDRRAGLVAAAVAGLSPYVLGLVHSGLSEFLAMGPVTLAAWATLRALGRDPRDRPAPPRAWAWAGLALGVAGSHTAYYGLFGALFAALAVPGPGWRDRLPVAARIVGLGALVAAPFGLGALSTLGGAVSAETAPGWAATLPATDIFTFLHPGPYYFPDTPAQNNPGILHVNYLGWAAVGLALLGARGRWVLPGVLYAVFALGPRLAVGQTLVTVAGAHVLLPLGVLYFPGSPFEWVHQPYRMVAFLMPWLAVAAARGAMRLPPAARVGAAAVILVETLAVSPARWPLATRAAPEVATYAALPPGPVLDWPPDASLGNRDYLWNATAHGRAVPYGVNVFLGEELRQDPLVDALLRALGRLERRSRNRDVPFVGPILLRPEGTSTRLGELGFVAVVVHKAALDNREWGRTRSLLDAAFGPAEREDTEVAVWRVR